MNRTTLDEKQVLELHSHRNGISGTPFHVAFVEDNIDGEMKKFLVVQFGDDPMNTAVLEMEKLKEEDIEFGSNSWRGDHYADVMEKAIKLRNEEIIAELEAN